MTICYTVPEMRCVIDRRTDGWKKWHIKVGAPPKNNICILFKTLSSLLLKMFMRKLKMERKKKGFNYFNKTSKVSDVGIRVVHISRCSITVTYLVNSSKNLQYSNTSGLETSEMKWNLNCSRNLLQKSQLSQLFSDLWRLYQRFN